MRDFLAWLVACVAVMATAGGITAAVVSWPLFAAGFMCGAAVLWVLHRLFGCGHVD